MVRKISQEALSKLSEDISSATGLYFSPENWRDLEKRMTVFAHDLGFQELDDCIQWMRTVHLSERQVKQLGRRLTIGETYFFRDAGNFQLLKDVALPERIHAHQFKDRQLNIWSAACATGEEIYSISIVLDMLLPHPSSWEVYLLGTDLNDEFLNKAACGRYREWSFRKVDTQVKQKYFQQSSQSEYTISPRLRKLVHFRYLNLVDDIQASRQGGRAWDVIFCCNVLIYFSSAQIKQVVDGLVETLEEGGWLFVSAVEVPFVQHDHLASIRIGNSVAFKKTAKECVEDAALFPKNALLQEHGSLSLRTLSEKEADAPQVSEKEGNVEKGRAEIDLLRIVDAYDRGEYEEVIKQLLKNLEPIQDDAIQLQNNINEMTLLIRAYANHNDPQSALKWCAQALQIEKLSPVLYYLHANLLEETRATEEAVQSLKKALFLDENFVMAHFLLAHLMLRAGNPKDAARSFRNALQILKSYPPQIVLPWSDGIQAGSLVEIISNLLKQNNNYT